MAKQTLDGVSDELKARHEAARKPANGSGGPAEKSVAALQPQANGGVPGGSQLSA